MHRRNTSVVVLRSVILWSCVGFVSLASPTDSSGQTSAERLGYPTGSRVVLFEGRDMGSSWESNEAGTKLIESGQLQSLDVLAVGPWFHDFAEWSQKHPDADIGVSVALSNPYTKVRWRLITATDPASTLVDVDGYPWQSVLQVATHVSPEEAAREIDAQIRAARNAGVHVTHLSGYHGTVFSRPDLAAVFLAAARKHWIPAPVVDITPEHIERFKKQGFPIDDEMIRLVQAYSLPKLDDIQVFPEGQSLDQKRERLCELIRALKPGLTQINLEPAIASDGLKRFAENWQQRVWDAQLVGDEKVKACLAKEKIVLTNWREIMQRFNGLIGPQR